jgi:hypothetical protein
MALVAGFVLLVSACGGGTEGTAASAAPETRPEGAASPEEAVVSLTRSLAAGRFLEASDLTVHDQMVVVALAEGLDVDGALALMETGAGEVGINFWEGFATSLEDFLGYAADDIEIGPVSTFEIEERRFARVDVFVPLDSSIRHFVLQEDDGWRVDVIATFASALAGKLPEAADRVRGDPAGGPLLQVMRDHLASLQAVLADNETQPHLTQAALAAIERIQR